MITIVTRIQLLARALNVFSGGGFGLFPMPRVMAVAARALDFWSPAAKATIILSLFMFIVFVVFLLLSPG